jgi:hypothetical protein
MIKLDDDTVFALFEAAALAGLLAGLSRNEQRLQEPKWLAGLAQDYALYMLKAHDHVLNTKP